MADSRPTSPVTDPWIVATEGAWRVRSGEAIVFAVELDADERPAGRRSLIGAIAAGAIVFGSAHRDEAGRYGVVVSASPASLERIELGALGVVEREQAVRAHLTMLFGERPEPSERGNEATVPLHYARIDVVAGTRVVAAAPVAYARLEQGAGTYFGAPVGHGEIVPLSPQHGFHATADSTLVPLGRVTDPTVADVAAALDTAANAMWLSWRVAASEDNERRLQREMLTRTRDSAALERAIGSLRDLLDPRSAGQGPPVDPIFAAAQIVARASKIVLTCPTDHYPDAEAMVRAIADASRVPIRRVSLRGRWWRREQGPLLAFTDGRPVALLPTRGGSRYVVVDPSEPLVRTLVDDAHAARFDPGAYVFVRPLPSRPIGVRDLLAVATHGAAIDFARLIGFGFVAGLLGTVGPLAVGLVYGTVIPAGLRGSLWLVALGLVIAGASATGIELVRNLLVLRLQTRASGKAQAAIMARLVSLPASFFARYAVGDLADRALAVETIQRYATGATLSVTLTALFSLSSFLVIAWYDVHLALVCAGLAAIAAGAAVIEALLTLPLFRELSARGGAISAYVLQMIGGIAKLRVCRAESRAFVGWLQRFIVTRRLTIRTGRIGYRFGIFQSVWPGVATLALVADIALFRSATISAGAFLAISAAFGQVLGGLLALGDALTSIVRAVPAYERAKPLLDASPEAHAGNADPGRLSGAIALRRVAFSYVDGQRILDQIDLTIGRGEFVAIVGASGSGKSTLFRLLLGFERPEEGAVLYDGRDLASLDLAVVRRQIGCVLQTAKTLPGSIFENIACGTILTRDEAWEAARSVGLASDIVKLPMRMETMLGDDGGGISGGQRQRILIARAIAHKPRIVFFDEATSALDNETQAIVTDSLRTMRATRVVIAHRLSTIVHADRIVVLDKGRIVQAGTYASLIEKPGVFADLAFRQQI